MSSIMRLRWLKVAGGAVAVLIVASIVAVFLVSGTEPLPVGEQPVALSSPSEDIGGAVDASVNEIKSPNETAARNVMEGLIIAIVSLTILAFSSLVISFWLYRWRRAVIGGKEIVVPEDWRKTSIAINQTGKALIQATENLNAQSVKAEKASHEDANDLRAKISELAEMLMILQQQLDDKDAEIRRLKKGYDAEIFRKFLHRFIRVDQAIGDYLDSGQIDLDGLKQIDLVLEDAFDECGAMSFSPQIGDDYTTTEGVADNPKIVRTADSDLFGKIKEVFEPGYKLNTGEIITFAKVSVYGQFSEEQAQ